MVQRCRAVSPVVVSIYAGMLRRAIRKSVKHYNRTYQGRLDLIRRLGWRLDGDEVEKDISIDLS